MAFVAFLAVLIGGPIVLTLAVLVGFVVAVPLAWAPVMFQIKFSSLVAGIAGGFGVVVFAHWMFHLIAPDSRGWLLPLSLLLALLIPTLNDLRRAKLVAIVAAELPATLRTDGAAAHAGTWFKITGYWIGAMAASAAGWVG